MHSIPGYRTLVGRIRDNLRALVRKHLELPKQEIAEIVAANLRAVKWFGIALGLGLLAMIAFVVLAISLVALVLPWPLAALVVFVVFVVVAGAAGYVGYKRLDLRGPTRSIDSVKETIQWAKAKLLGRSAS